MAISRWLPRCHNSQPVLMSEIQPKKNLPAKAEAGGLALAVFLKRPQAEFKSALWITLRFSFLDVKLRQMINQLLGFGLNGFKLGPPVQ